MNTFRHSAIIRWSDLNALGIVSDAAIASYIEETRAALVRKVASTDGVSASGRSLVCLTVRQCIDYLTPVAWQESPLETSLHVTRIRSAAVELMVHVGGAERPSARATVLSVCWDTTRNRPRTLSTAQRDMLTEYLQPPTVQADPSGEPVDGSGPAHHSTGNGRTR
ncbi:acyl-CoA thioesterase [Streptomyces flavofungini]|uniref:acyl-CoA thioesterase n=1 Tax=Streptomyces flavofungini TaxID=68200 RepID=UPI0034DDE589